MKERERERLKDIKRLSGRRTELEIERETER